jgi:NNP family nitrate/nitrite transporter-like MFS transporter
VLVLAVLLAFTYKHIVSLTIACLLLAGFLGFGKGAVFKLVPTWFPDRVAAVTGVVGAAAGLASRDRRGDREVGDGRLRAAL